MIEHLITSTVLILCILLIRMIFGNRMSQRLKYGLWILVAVKLLVPLPLYETDFSIMNVVQFVENHIGNEKSVKPATEAVSAQNEERKTTSDGLNSEFEQHGMQKSDTENINDTDTENVVKKQSELEQREVADTANAEHVLEETEEKASIPFKTLCVYIWLAGVILFVSIFLMSNIRFYLRLRKDRKQTSSYPCKLKIYETHCVDTPCLFGMIKPAIYLPTGLLLGEENMHHIMTHELTHYKHKDHIWAYIRCLCVVIYWYHPLIWLSAFLSIKDSELACDEGAVKCLGEENRKAYGVTLIEMASGYSAVSNHLVCSTSIMGGKKEMKKRIEMLVKKPKMLVSTFAAFLVLVIGVTGCTFSSAKNEEEKVVEIETNADSNATKTKEKKKTEIGGDTEQTKKTEETIRTTPISASLEKKLEDVPVGAYCLSFCPDELSFHEVFVEGLNNPDSVEKTDGVDIQTMEEMRGMNTQESVYYVPDEDQQKKIQELLEHPEKTEKIPTHGTGDCEEVDYQWIVENIEYEEQWIKEHNQTVYAGCSLLYKTDSEEGFQQYDVKEDGTIVEEYMVMVNPKLCNYLSKILKDEFQYETLDVATIKNIESATLEYVHPKTKKQYSQTIKEKEILDKFENWFSHAKACYSGDCPYFNGLLTLKLKNGKVITLTMASSGVTYFSVNGGLYDYEPKNKPEGFDAYAVFECFDKIPYYVY